jgi:fructosamine-3-kinase
MTSLIQSVSTLELLRKNVSEEVDTTEAALEAILRVLTVRQKAHFLLHVEFWYANVLKLKSMWDAFAKRSLGLIGGTTE